MENRGQGVVAHTFNPRSWELGSGGPHYKGGDRGDMAGQKERNTRQEETGTHCSRKFGGERWILEMRSQYRIAPLVSLLVKEFSNGFQLCFSDLRH